jgi:hypothetical protein
LCASRKSARDRLGQRGFNGQSSNRPARLFPLKVFSASLETGERWELESFRRREGPGATIHHNGARVATVQLAQLVAPRIYHLRWLHSEWAGRRLYGGFTVIEASASCRTEALLLLMPWGGFIRRLVDGNCHRVPPRSVVGLFITCWRAEHSETLQAWRDIIATADEAWS